MTDPAEVPFECSKCGGPRGCDCGAPFVPQGTRVRKALEKYGSQSDRAIAKLLSEQGRKINQSTVSRIRKATDAFASVGFRTGLDGKTRKMPIRSRAPSDLEFSIHLTKQFSAIFDILARPTKNELANLKRALKYVSLEITAAQELRIDQDDDGRMVAGYTDQGEAEAEELMKKLRKRWR